MKNPSNYNKLDLGHQTIRKEVPCPPRTIQQQLSEPLILSLDSPKERCHALPQTVQQQYMNSIIQYKN